MVCVTTLVEDLLGGWIYQACSYGIARTNAFSSLALNFGAI